MRSHVVCLFQHSNQLTKVHKMPMGKIPVQYFFKILQSVLTAWWICKLELQATLVPMTSGY